MREGLEMGKGWPIQGTENTGVAGDRGSREQCLVDLRREAGGRLHRAG